MKKLIFTTVALVALTLSTNAQVEPAKKETKPKAKAKKEAAAKPAAATSEAATVETAPAKTESPKKSGTRMAINEKGLPGEKKPNSNSTNNPK